MKGRICVYILLSVLTLPIVSWTGNTKAQAAELSATDGAVWLVAPDATVRTSNLSAAEGTSPQAIIDHDLSTLYWTGRAMQSGDYIEIDLGRVYPLNGVALLMASYSGASARPYDYLYNGRILVSEDGRSWTKVGSDLRGVPEFFTTFPEQPARYVRVVATADQVYWVQVREFLVSVPTEAAPHARPAAIHLEQAGQQLERAREMLTRAEGRFLSFDRSEVHALLAEAEVLLDQAQAAYDRNEDALAVELAGRASGTAEIGGLRTYEARNVEVRAAWVDRGVLAAGPDSIIQTLDRLQALGINLIYPEVISKGAAAYPSRVYPRDPEFFAWPGDVMEFLVDAAHDRGMEVHPWVWVLCAGYHHQLGPLMQRHPEWTELSADGDVFAPNEFGTAWLSPVLPEVRSFLAQAFVELVTRYDVDGIHFDYIRYNEEGYRAFGFSKASLEAFKEATGLDARNLTTYAERLMWDRWREGNVTRVVRELVAALREARPDIKISAAVVSNPADAIRDTHQNWAEWLNLRLLDHVALMNYTDSLALFTSRNQQAASAVARGAVLPGIGIWTITPQDVVEQVAAVHELGLPGVVFFAASTLQGETARVLLEGPFREPALSPFADPRAALEREVASLQGYVSAWVESGALPVSAAEVVSVLARLVDAARSETARSAYTELLAVARTVADTDQGGGLPGHGQAAERLLHRVTALEYLVRIMESGN